ERRDNDSILAVRLGLSMVKGLPSRAGETIVRTRRDGPFVSYNDFAARTGLPAAVLSRLAAADTFRSLSLPRRPALWQSVAATSPLPLFTDRSDIPPPTLPRLDPAQEVILDYHSQGLSLRGHPLSALRESLQTRRVVPASALQELKPGRRYRVAGLVLLRQ